MPSLAIHTVFIPERFRRVTNLQSISIVVKIIDNLFVTGNKVLFTPSSGVNITIYGPTNAVLVNNAAMELITTGHYIYAYKQDGTTPVGVHSCKFTASHSGTSLNTDKYYIFTTSPQVFT